MTHDLYFLPPIARALHNSDPADQLHDAFTDVVNTGGEGEYAHGFQQFKRFMSEVARTVVEDRLREFEDDAAFHLIIDLASESFVDTPDLQQAALELIEEREEWRAELARLKQDLEKTVSATPTIQVRRDNAILARFELSLPSRAQSLMGVHAGRYALTLDTGRLLWAGALREEHLLWTAAFGPEPLPMAAETDETPGRATLEHFLLEGTLVLRVYPGLESGRIEIELVDSAEQEYDQ